jgi:hypothetical protein
MARPSNIKIAKKPKVRDDSTIVSTYAELEQIAMLFAQGKYPFIILGGAPGLAKSTTFRRAVEAQVGRDYLLLEANASARGAYPELFTHKDKPVLFDDADQLFQNADGMRLLKQLGQTEHWKQISRVTKEFTNRRSVIPSSFWTSSNVCIITNQADFNESNVHIKAILDRAMLFTFAPTGLEIYRFVARWYWDQEIYDFIGRHYPFLEEVSCRLFYNCWIEKRAGREWRRLVLSRLWEEGSIEYRVVELLTQAGQATKQEKVSELMKAGIKRSTAYNYVNSFDDRYNLKEMPRLEVKGEPPSQEPPPGVFHIETESIVRNEVQPDYLEPSHMDERPQKRNKQRPKRREKKKAGQGRIDELTRKMDLAIKLERYEEAAHFRDELNKLTATPPRHDAQEREPPPPQE